MALRNPDQSDVRPLRFNTTPEPGESLIGLVARATRVNVLESPFVPIRRAGIKITKPGTVSLLDSDAIMRLAAVIGCQESNLLAAGTPYVHSETPGQTVRFGTAVLLRTDLSLQRRRVSPISLSVSGHHRDSWLVGLLPYCVESLERLRDDCSECGKKLGWLKSWGIEICEHCEERIAPSSLSALPERLIQNYRFFADLISTQDDARTKVLAQLPADVRDLSASAMLDVCLLLGATCREDPIDAPRFSLSRQKPETVAEIVANGVGFLRAWPHSIRTWADEQGKALTVDPDRFKSLRRRLRSLGMSRHRTEQAKLIRSALPDLFLSVNRSFADPGSTFIGSDVCREVGFSTDKLRSLREATILSFRSLPSTYRSRCQYDASEVAAIAERLRMSLPLGKPAEILGLPIYAIEQMCCYQLLERDIHPAVLHLRADPQITNESMETLLSSFDLRCQRTAPRGTLSLRLASRRFGGKAKPWAAIVAALLDGSLPFRMKAGRRFIDRIQVIPKDLERFDGMSFDETAWPSFPFSRIICQRDAQELLNIGPTQMARAKADGVAEFPLRQYKGRYCEKSTILDVAHRIISTSEFQYQRRVTRAVALRRLASLGLEKISYGWNRRELKLLPPIST